MSNQASEDVLKEITEILLMYKASLVYEQVEPQHEWLGSIDIEEAKLDLLAIIRTENLKLLAAVRERVVGSLEPQNENGLLPDRVDRRNQLRTEQLEVLTKLEAEL